MSLTQIFGAARDDTLFMTSDNCASCENGDPV
jgi:hypothetical protein